MKASIKPIAPRTFYKMKDEGGIDIEFRLVEPQT